MGIFDIMQQPGEELSPQELQRKADEFDRVGDYHRDRAEQDAKRRDNK